MAENINELAKDWLERTVWIWLPFASLKILIQDVIAKHHKEEDEEK